MDAAIIISIFFLFHQHSILSVSSMAGVSVWKIRAVGKVLSTKCSYKSSRAQRWRQKVGCRSLLSIYFFLK
jgi:hypothetical protein